MSNHELGYLGSLGKDTGTPFPEGFTEDLAPGKCVQESGEGFFLISKRGFKMQILAIDTRNSTHSRTLFTVEHVMLNASKAISNMIGMVAHGRIEVCKENLDQDFGRNRGMSGHDVLTLKKLAQAMEGCDHLVAHGDDEVRAHNKVYFLVFGPATCILMVGTMSREVEYHERSLTRPRDKRKGTWREELALEPLADTKLRSDLPYLFVARLFEVDPDTTLVLLAIYHVLQNTTHTVANKLACYTPLMETTFSTRLAARIATRSVAFAIVAAISFGAGLILGGRGTTAAVISHVPFIGDALDGTPDMGADMSDFWKAWNALDANYVNTHASSTLPTRKEKIFGAIQGLAASYGDPYTVFFPPKEAKVFAENISGSLAGVGMEIDVKGGVLVVVAPLKGTPAAGAGVAAGDQIAAIDGTATDGLSVEAAVAAIRGPAGTTVALTLVRAGKVIDIKIVRATIQVPETEDGLEAGSGVYHIALYEFTANSAPLFNQALSRFKASGSTKLIIDLRGNPGGYLDAAVDIASHFLPKGAAIVTEDFGGKSANTTHTSSGVDGIPPGTKIVVLIDGGSASASEILAGALQDNHAATIIGTHSFGKGSVQTLLDLDGGSLKVTVARWVTPAGHWIMDQGVVPDLVASSTPGAVRGGKDPQMTRAVQFLTSG